jgi:hypothetical protein
MIGYGAVKYCQQCGNNYPDEMNFCVVDNTRLALNSPEAQTLLNDFPTIPASFEYVPRKFTLAEGDFLDLECDARKLRITLKQIIEETFVYEDHSEGKEYGAFIYVHGSISPIYGGQQTIKKRSQEYIVPIKGESLEGERSLFYFIADSQFFEFFRIYVEHINLRTRHVVLDVVFVSYSTPRPLFD